MAQMAVEMTLDLLDQKEAPTYTLLPGRLIVRGSTAPPGDDRAKA
jgi:DNA-binding LacI/PurR family transcriptional regulator